MSARAWMPCLLLAALPALAQAPGVTAAVDRADVFVDEMFLIRITATGARVAEPVIPHADGIRINRSAASARQTAAGREWSIRAWATREGRLTIPAIQVRISGVTYESAPITINAVRTAVPAPNPASQAQAPTLGEAFFLDASVDKTRVYQGQAVELVCTVWCYPAVQADDRWQGAIPPPATEGFYAAAWTGPRRREESKGAWTYQVTEYRQTLFPTGAGILTIGPWTWQGRLRFSTMQGRVHDNREYKTNPIDIEVRPLPERPGGFSGAVGQFSLRASILQGDIVQGTPTTLVLRVEGDGNPDAIGAPPLPEIPWAHVSAPEIETAAVDRAGSAKVAKQFKFSLTPLVPGEQLIPELRFVYFSPVLNQYKTESAGPLRVHVLPSGEDGRLVTAGGLPQPERTRVDILGDDVFPILSAPRAPRPRGSATAAAMTGALLPPLLYGAGFLAHRRRNRFAGDSTLARRHFAQANALAKLRAARKTAAPLDELHSAMAGYLADLYNSNAAGMTSQDARNLLDANSIDGGLSEPFVKAMRACERKRYAGAQVSSEEQRALLDGAEAALIALDRARRKERRS